MKEERAAQGLDHLHAAAVEIIQAARAFLDVAEDLIADNRQVGEVVAAFGSVADAATRAARGAAPGRPAADRSDGEPAPDRGPVTHQPDDARNPDRDPDSDHATRVL